MLPFLSLTISLAFLVQTSEWTPCTGPPDCTTVNVIGSPRLITESMTAMWAQILGKLGAYQTRVVPALTSSRQAKLTADAMPRLKVMKGLEEYWVECNRLENEGDSTYRMLLVRLFSGEYDALTVLKMKEVVDELERACDAFERVANTVETIAVKES